MSKSAIISNEKKDSKSQHNDSIFFKNILMCKCGQFHELKLKFVKEYHIIFPCCKLKLSEINKLNDFHSKCNDCKAEIYIKKDYYEKTKQYTKFICEKCAWKYTNKHKPERKFDLISNIKEKEDIQRTSIKNKFIYFIEHNGKILENEFYNNNLSQVKLFQQFVDYLCFIRKLYSKENQIYKIIKNFIYYAEKFIDIAIKNINIYDLYHFNKRTVIYSYCNEAKIRFLSPNFKIIYNELLSNCLKGDYLSIEMFKYIYQKYEEDKLVNHLEFDLIDSKYCKIKEINFGKEIFLKATKLRLKYLDITSILSELENESEIINLKTEIMKLEEEYHLDKYINSFLDVPGQFSILRKSASLILDKIIKNNQEKLNFISPSETIIDSTLYLISTIKKQLIKYKKGTIMNSIQDKLKTLEITLEKYKNNKINRKGKEKINYLSIPIINLEEDEKLFLANNLEKEKEERTFSKISVSDSTDQYLDFIINFLFEIIHLNDKEILKFSSISQSEEKLPYKEEDLKETIEKIKNLVGIFPQYDKITYDGIIGFLFGLKINNFMKIENKIDYLLSFLYLSLKKLSDIDNKYKEIKRKIEKNINKIMTSINIFNEEADNIKNVKFINKYGIKTISKDIFNYLDYLVKYTLRQLEEDKIDSDDEEEEEIIDIGEIFKNQEKNLREKISDLIHKDTKFITYIPNYLNIKLKEHIDVYVKNVKDKLLILKTNIKEENLLFLKLEKIKDIILSIKLYNFDIKTHFDEFVKEYEEILPEKKLCIENKKGVNAGITNFDTFVKTLKGYIGNINKNVELSREEPSQFVLKLFLEKIGLYWT